VLPVGTVLHPENKNLVSSLTFPLIFGKPVIITERSISLFLVELKIELYIGRVEEADLSLD
jgi:hypothetical protein